jgi:hypothetical protein
MMSFSEKKKDQVLTQDWDNSISHCPIRRLTRQRERLPISSSSVGAAGYLIVSAPSSLLLGFIRK